MEGTLCESSCRCWDHGESCGGEIARAAQSARPESPLACPRALQPGSRQPRLIALRGWRYHPLRAPTPHPNRHGRPSLPTAQHHPKLMTQHRRRLPIPPARRRSRCMQRRSARRRRTSDRLLRAGLLDRRESPVGRRNVTLTLTFAGRRLVDTVIKHRRRAIERVLRKMTPSQRDVLAAALATVASAAGEPVDDANILTLWPPTSP